MTVDGIKELGRTEEEAKIYMTTAVDLAAFSGASVALALGPYGATLRPGAEYTGIYPGEYGGPNSQEALAKWHADRVKVYAEDAVWGSIEYVAFETVPDVHELRAIRSAMSGLEKPFWVAMCFPEGRHPSGEGMGGVVDALIGGDEPIPIGLGINCTNPAYLEQLVSDMTTAVRSKANGKRFTLVVYPDGGAVYDPATKTWSEEDGPTPEAWAKQVFDIVKKVDEDVWSNVIVGGCCKTSFAEIKALRQLVDAQE